MPVFAKDLGIVISLTILTLVLIFIPGLSESSLRIVFGLPFVLFLPGYSLIAILFPRKDDLDGIERMALSFGLSIAVVPLIGLILNYTPYGIRLVPVAFSLSIFTVVLALGANYRRATLPIEERFFVSFDLRGKVSFRSETRLDRALTILLILSILTALVALVYVIATPKQGERFTEFYILGSEGRAASYPTDLRFGVESSLIVGVTNQEYRSINYTLDIVLANTSQRRMSLSLPHNGTWEEVVSYKPMILGDNLKLEFLLYNESLISPYRSLHLWVNVR